MKKILGFIILFGFIIMVGAAGSGDFSGMSFSKVLVLELLGMFMMLFGVSALMHYKRYLRRMVKLRRRKESKILGAAEFGRKIRVPERELC